MYFVWLTDRQQRVWRDYVALTGALQAAMNRRLQRDHELSLSDYDVLVALAERPGCRISELGRRLGWEQSRLSHQLGRMRDRGLVTRRADAADRRAAAVELTARGESALREAAPQHAEQVRRVVFDGLSRRDLDVLARWTTGVLTRLENE